METETIIMEPDLSETLKLSYMSIGHEYLMGTRAVIVMAQYLDNKGILAVRAAYPNLDTCYANVQAMIANYGQMNPRQTIVP